MGRFAHGGAGAAPPALVAGTEALLHAGLCPQTRASYAATQLRFVTFARKQLHIAEPLPPSCAALALWVTSLANDGVAAVTISGYLSAVRSWCVDEAIALPMAGPGGAQLARVVAGVERTQLRTGRRRRVSLPITPPLAEAMLAVMPAVSLADLAVRAALAVGVAGLMRMGELTRERAFRAPSAAAAVGRGAALVVYDRVLRVGDVERRPAGAVIALRFTKTDQSGRCGDRSFIGAAFALRELDAYLARRGAAAPSAPLFALDDGSPLLRRPLLTACHGALAKARALRHGEHFNAISFRAGGATQFALNGGGEPLLRGLGHWRSDASKFYVRPDVDAMLAVASTVATPAPRSSST